VALLTQGKEVMGKAEFKVTRGKFDYLFASAENKTIFEKAPEKYEIQLSGACARMGGGVTGNPADYAVVDGKIYIFGSDDCHKKFVAAPAKFLPKPAAPMPTAAADLRAGRALVDKAVAAIGGATRVDAITTYVDTATQKQKRPAGEAAVTIKTMRRLPGDVRVERSMTLGERTQQNTQLVTKDGGWFMAQGRAFPQNPEGAANTRAESGRHLVTLLRGRSAPGFTAAALPAATVDGVAVDRVRIKNGGVDVTLNLDKASGRVHSMTFTGRNMEAEIGECTLLLSDYRDVSGLRLPFSERALFNGAPDDFMTRTIQSIEINAPLDASLFAPPAAGGQ
jgi:YHS domain-containing protein